MYIFCHFDEVSAIRWPKMMTFSNVPKCSLRISLFLPEMNEKLHTSLTFTTLLNILSFLPHEKKKLKQEYQLIFALSTNVNLKLTFLNT